MDLYGNYLVHRNGEAIIVTHFKSTVAGNKSGGMLFMINDEPGTTTISFSAYEMYHCGVRKKDLQDIIQTVAKKYLSTFTHEEIKNKMMSGEVFETFCELPHSLKHLVVRRRGKVVSASHNDLHYRVYNDEYLCDVPRRKSLV